MDEAARLRVALLAAHLGRGGAETQLVYMARALHEAGVEVRVFSLTRGQPGCQTLAAMGLAPCEIGGLRHPLFRLAALTGPVRRFSPHVIQSTHSFANLYVGLLGRSQGTISLGALRCSLRRCREANGLWTRALMTCPSAIAVNSHAARDEMLESRLLAPERLFLLANVVDLAQFDREAGCAASLPPHAGATAIFVGRLIGVKRADRFLHALALAARQEPGLRGVVVGDGPERPALEQLASQLGLAPGQILFLGERGDVPRLLRDADLLVHCSDDEGCSNVLLEAMAARLPVIATPVGDAPRLIQDGGSGYLALPDDAAGLAERIVRLARSRQLRQRLGQAGRQQVERHYSFDGLADRLLSVYGAVAARAGRRLPLSNEDSSAPRASALARMP